MSLHRDVLIVGAGPAGAEAAMTVADHGIGVILADEAPAAGGQVYRAPPPGFAGLPETPESRKGDELRRRLAESAVETRFDHLVWSVSNGFRVDALGPGGPVSWTGRVLVAATGAQERVVPFPGWTLPGVIGLAGATILLKSQRMLPGRRTVVAGQGPLLFAVAAGLLKAGGQVVAVIDLASWRGWVAQGPALASRPDLAVRGVRWLTALRWAGVPILYGHAVRRAAPGVDSGIVVTVGPVDGDGRPIRGRERTFAADALAVGNGLTSSVDITRLLKVEHIFDELRGGWIPRVDTEFRTSAPGLHVVGDGAGIAGAAAAAIDGRLTGLAIARDLGVLDARTHEAKAAPLRRDARRARLFGTAMARLMTLRPGQVEGIPEDTVVCRCEDVTRLEIEAACADGARSPNQLKAWTRCGMGPCQGRICGDVASALVAKASGLSPRPAGFTGRTPFRPLPVDRLIAPIDYADLELPPPAPL